MERGRHPKVHEQHHDRLGVGVRHHQRLHQRQRRVWSCRGLERPEPDRLCDHRDEQFQPGHPDCGYRLALARHHYLRTGSANYYLRGLAFAPVQPPVPACTVPTITGNPSPQTVTTLSNATFTVGATGVDLIYQWQRNGSNVSDGGSITGLGTPSLTLSNLSTANSGSSWDCVVSSGTCTTNSSTAALTVYTPYQAWQFQYFNSTNAANAALSADADGTGQNNLYKFVAGLDPTNPASVFVLTIRNVAGQPTQKQLQFTPLAAGRTYTPWFNTNLVGGPAPLTTYTGPTTNGSTVTLTDTNPPRPRRFTESTFPCPNPIMSATDLDRRNPKPNYVHGLMNRTQSVALSFLLLTGLFAAHATEPVPFAATLPAQAHCAVEIAALHPTQFAVGLKEVEIRAAKFRRCRPPN